MCTCIWSMFLSWGNQILCRDIFVSAIIESECYHFAWLQWRAPICLGAVQDHAHWHQPFARKPKPFFKRHGDMRFWVTWSTITCKIGVEFPLIFSRFQAHTTARLWSWRSNYDQLFVWNEGALMCSNRPKPNQKAIDFAVLVYPSNCKVWIFICNGPKIVDSKGAV